jgi:OmpA-OmpF porin, OOP family
MGKLFTRLMPLAIFAAISAASAQELKPTQAEALVDVLVTDMSNNPSSGDKLTFRSVASGKEYTVTSGADGIAKLLLPKGGSYEIVLQGFDSGIDYNVLEIPEFDGLVTQQIQIAYELPKTYTLENIYFETASSKLTRESFPALEMLASLLNSKKSMSIEISGHTDNIGEDAYNRKLSEDRANAVKSYLVSKGVQPARLKSVGHGASMPVADNATEAGRQENRRISLQILEK